MFQFIRIQGTIRFEFLLLISDEGWIHIISTYYGEVLTVQVRTKNKYPFKQRLIK